MTKSELTGKNQGKDGRFIKGNKANPTGKNGFSSISSLIEALQAHGKKQSLSFWDYVAERAYNNEQVLIAVLKKVLPDKIQGEGFGDITNLFALVQRIQQEFVQEDSKPSVGVDSRAGLHERRARLNNPDQEIS